MRCFAFAPILMAALFVPSIAARADGIQPFQVNATFGPGYTLSGTIDIDTTAGLVTGADLSTNFDPGTPFVTETFFYKPAGATGEVREFWWTPSGTPFQSVDLFIPRLAPGYTGGSLCLNLSQCTDEYESGVILFNQFYGLNTGSLTLQQPSPTPEPSSLALLGTGALGIMGVIRRKLS